MTNSFAGGECRAAEIAACRTSVLVRSERIAVKRSTNDDAARWECPRTRRGSRESASSEARQRKLARSCSTQSSLETVPDMRTRRIAARRVRDGGCSWRVKDVEERRSLGERGETRASFALASSEHMQSPLAPAEVRLWIATSRPAPCSCVDPLGRRDCTTEAVAMKATARAPHVTARGARRRVSNRAPATLSAGSRDPR